MHTYDAIVIGSGITGGWAAKELTEKGLRTIMLERGRYLEHVKDYVTASKQPWELPHRGMTPLADREARPVVGNSWASTEATIHSWVNESDCPYTQVKPFSWFRSYQLGGRSLLWGRQCYRWSDLDFGANARDGWAIDWPLRYKDLEGWYDHVERHIGVSGSREGLSHLPDGHYLPPMDMNCVEKEVAARLQQRYNGERHMIVGRVANLTAPIEGRSLCQFRNRCWEGCPFGGYFSTQSSTLPAAMRTGKLTVRPFSIVTKILYDKDRRRATGVEVLDAETFQTYVYRAKLIFLNASTLNSAWVLMNSATDVWPDGLGSSCGELGHNIMDHHMGVGAYGLAEGFEDKYYYGRRPALVYIPRFANMGSDKRDYLRGFGYLGSASRQEWQRNIAELGIGVEMKAVMTEPGQWAIGITGFGEQLPYHDNRVYLDKSRHDKWGLPVLAMDVCLQDNELRMRKDMQQEAQAMLEAAGMKGVTSWLDGHSPGAGIHEMGSARMGRDPRSSVLNPHNQVWDAPNVYVTDGACMVSSACQNPSLTYMALTARAVDHAVGELSRQNL